MSDGLTHNSMMPQVFELLLISQEELLERLLKNIEALKEENAAFEKRNARPEA